MAWFTVKVTLPFLNMCELQKQPNLSAILPQLNLDLESLKMNTLVEFEVFFSFKVDEPDSVLGKVILKEFWKQAAIDLTTQRGEEWGFAEHEKSRATDINEIPKEQVDYMPVNNLDCERDLAKSNQLPKQSAMWSSKKFTANGIGDEMTLIQAKNIKIEKITKNIAKVLDDKEKIWVKSQNLFHEQRLKKDAEKTTYQFEYVNSLLTKCKEHGGPFVSTEEIEQCLHNIDDDIEKKRILRVEILYCRHSCGSDAQQRPHLYKVNQLSLTKMIINIATLLTNNFVQSLDIPPIPSEDEVVQLLSLQQNQLPINELPDVPEQHDFEPKINKPCIVIWDEQDGRKWFVAMCQKKLDSQDFLIDYLEQVRSAQAKRCWQYPLKPDEQITLLDQIIPVNASQMTAISK